MGDELVNIPRVAEIVRKKMVKDEDYDGGQRMLNAVKALGRLPQVGGRPVVGMDETYFDGNTALADQKMRLESLREERLARMTQAKNRKS